MTDLTSEVARRLAAVPHGPTCYAESADYFCECDREARIAALVAAAIEAAADVRYENPDWREAALRALEGTPE